MPDVRFSGNQVTPDEMDRYEQYQVINPAISATFFGSATANVADAVGAIGLGNTRADYPRAIAAYFSGSASVSGTVAVVGKDQFGVVVSESLALTQGTQTAGTPASTNIYAQITSATVTMGTGVIGTGTVSLGVPIAAGAAKFGLPAKIGAVSDVKAITWTNATGVAIPINGGTIASATYVDATTHAFVGSATLAGTQTYTVLFKPSYVAESLAKMANL